MLGFEFGGLEEEIQQPTATTIVAALSGHTKTNDKMTDQLFSDMMMGDDSDDDDDIAVIAAAGIIQAAAPLVPASTLLLAELSSAEGRKEDHTGRRGPRKKYDHALTYRLIQDHYLGPNPLHGSQFKLHFRVSLSTFQYIYEKIMNSGDPFYVSNYRGPRASNEARILLPLKVLAYGEPPSCFMAYFNMSDRFASDCCDHFDTVMINVFKEEFLRFPSVNDLRAVVKYHKEIYGVPGMFGSLDCTHTDWKSCPVAWQSSYKNRHNGAPSLILEALCDHHLWVWHFAYGYAGSMNDLNVMAESPLLESFLNGDFERLETEANVVPYKVGTEEFKSLYLLADGIYPAYSRFVRSPGQPISDSEKNFARWQESVRKDIERCFGVMKRQWKFLAHPIEIVDLDRIAGRVYTILVLHNMNVTARIMGDVRTLYNPTYDMSPDTTSIENIDEPPDARTANTESNESNVNNGMVSVLAARTRRFQDLRSSAECFRLTDALRMYVHQHRLRGAKKNHS